MKIKIKCVQKCHKVGFYFRGSLRKLGERTVKKVCFYDN